ncbi:MAG: hypothetical protein WBJ68_18160 [Candidatus Dechloromonas phosphoritropha]|jgi:metal-responsive CopG/Arc/MetJ family transcriptional regulator|nr:hypothetical protein [Candidatus Dechloromonas phosphoritropha]MBP6707862.1 hypothetical protein [Accumulibacter sp.]MBP8786945.1 hypothetical protein [Azonexus sp.]MBP9227418.1 hypothetical protein [Azonexus sp.]
MGTMNFSIPDDIKDDFNQTFAHENKSAVVAKLLREAVAQARRKQQSDEAIDRILARLGQERTRVSDEEIRRAREEGRP